VAVITAKTIQSVIYAKRLNVSAKACKGQGSRLPARILMIAPPARLHHGVNAAAMGVGNFAPWRRFTGKLRRAEQAQGSPHLLRRADANCDQRRIQSTWHRAAGSASFAEKLRLIARRAAVSGNQDFHFG